MDSKLCDKKLLIHSSVLVAPGPLLMKVLLGATDLWRGTLSAPTPPPNRADIRTQQPEAGSHATSDGALRHLSSLDCYTPVAVLHFYSGFGRRFISYINIRMRMCLCDDILGVSNDRTMRISSRIIASAYRREISIGEYASLSSPAGR